MPLEKYLAIEGVLFEFDFSSEALASRSWDAKDDSYLRGINERPWLA